jgi:hypothetical protein
MGSKFLCIRSTPTEMQSMAASSKPAPLRATNPIAILAGQRPWPDATRLPRQDRWLPGVKFVCNLIGCAFRGNSLLNEPKWLRHSEGLCAPRSTLCIVGSRLRFFCSANSSGKLRTLGGCRRLPFLDLASESFIHFCLGCSRSASAAPDKNR